MRRALSTLRWKLAASYVAVTLAVLVTLEALLLAISLPVVMYWMAPVMVAVTAQQLARDLAPAYVQSARPAADLQRLLQQRISEGQIISPLAALPLLGATAPRGDGAVSLQVSLANTQVWLFDAQGALITATQVLDTQARPGGDMPAVAAPIVAEALRGSRMVFATTILTGEHYLAAAPVQDAQARVVGALLLAVPTVPWRAIAGLFLSWLIYSMLGVLFISGPIGLVFGWVAGGRFSRRLKRLSAASAALAAGDLSRRVEDHAADEIGQLARQFNAMADQLTDHLRALRLLAEQNAQLAERSAQLAAIEERNRLARDLHDSVSQELFSLTMLAAAARRQLATHPEAVSAYLEEIITMAQHALQETRSLIFALRPAMLDGRGLAPALRDLVAGAAQRQGLTVALSIHGERALPLEQEQALFRIAQEALANVMRHSGTRQAELTLDYDDQETRLSVRDRGRGFDPNAPRHPRALGLVSMHERMVALGGTLQIVSAPGAGTTVTATLPRQHPADSGRRQPAHDDHG